MTRYVRKNIRSMAGYVPGEQPGALKYIKLNTNENPYPPSPKVLEAIKRAATDELRLYPDPLVATLLGKAKKAYGLPESSMIAGNGSDELLSIITRVFVGETDRVVYPYPTYTLYETLVQIQGGKTLEIPFPEDFSLPASEVSSSKGSVLFIANPNSPSGTFTPTRTIAKVANTFGGIVVVDEAYADFAGESALELVGKKDNLIVLRTFSKSFSLAGIRLGIGFAHPWIIGEMTKVKDSYNINSISLAAGSSALTHMAWMRKNVKKIIRTRERLSARLQELGFEVYPSRANFLLARIRGHKLDRLYLELKRRKILVRYFDTDRLSDCIRITIGTDEEVDVLLKNLEDIVEKGLPG